MDHDQRLLVGRQLRVGVVVANERHTLSRIAAQPLLVYLRLASTVRGVINGLTISTPEGFGIDRVVIGQALQLPRAEVHHIDFRIAIFRQYERQAIAIWRECRRTVQTFEVGDLFAATRIDVLNENTWTLLLEGHIGNTASVR